MGHDPFSGKIVPSTPWVTGDVPPPKPAVTKQYRAPSPNAKSRVSNVDLSPDNHIDPFATKLPQLGLQRDGAGDQTSVSTVVQNAKTEVQPGATALPKMGGASAEAASATIVEPLADTGSASAAAVSDPP